MAGNHCSHCPKNVREWLVLVLIVAALGVIGTYAWMKLGANGRSLAQLGGAVFGGCVTALILTLAISAYRDGRESKDTAPVVAPPPIELEPEPAPLAAVPPPLELEAAPDNVVAFPVRRITEAVRRASSE